MELLDIVDEKGNPDRRDSTAGRWHTVRESGIARRTCWIFADAARSADPFAETE
mgnify:CR=1 FL=1